MKYTKEQLEKSIQYWTNVLNEGVLGNNLNTKDKRDSRESFLKFINFLGEMFKQKKEKAYKYKFKIMIGDRGPLEMKEINIAKGGFFTGNGVIVFDVKGGSIIKENIFDEADEPAEGTNDDGTQNTYAPSEVGLLVKRLHGWKIKKMSKQLDGIVLNCQDAKKDTMKRFGYSDISFGQYQNIISTVIEKCEIKGTTIVLTFRASVSDQKDTELFS